MTMTDDRQGMRDSAQETAIDAVSASYSRSSAAPCELGECSTNDALSSLTTCGGFVVVPLARRR